MRTKCYFTVLCYFLALSLIVFFSVSCRKGDSGIPAGVSVSGEAGIPVIEPESFNPADEVQPKPVVLVLDLEEGEDIILSSYQDPALREWVLAFFENITGARDVAAAVLSNAAEIGIPPALAFALCYEESGYNPRAINHNKNETVDRGLFQLNSDTFPKLAVVDFYNPGVNARHGLSHLRWCLNNAGTDVAALAMYNAGHNRVRSTGTPKSTLDYISRILRRQSKIEGLFLVEYAGLTRTETAEEPKKAPFRLSLLTPLGGR